MSPEQALGEPATPQADLYSLGAMLYEMVTGSAPFVGDDLLAIVSQHLRTPPVAPAHRNPHTPKALNDLVMALLAKDPRKRPRSAGHVREALEALGAAHLGGTSGRRSGAGPSIAAPGAVYVGRERELDELCAAADAALGDSGQIVLIAGDPGIGKTRLAEQLASYGQLRGATVLWGRCYEGEGAPTYWPWMQVIRAYAANHDPELLTSVMGVGASPIAQTVSEVHELLPDLPAPPSVSAKRARFRLFDSVSTFLGNASCQEPLIVVLDDLHHADAASLMLLQFLARDLAGTRLLVVGTYRDTNLHRGHALTRTLAELERTRPPRRILLGGLTRGELARYFQLTTGSDADDAILALLHHKSEGNPFFAVEMLRSLGETDGLRPTDPATAMIVVPDEVRDVIGRRIEPLGAACREALTAAALIGRVSYSAVSRAAGRQPRRSGCAQDNPWSDSPFWRRQARTRSTRALCSSVSRRLTNGRWWRSPDHGRVGLRELTATTAAVVGMNGALALGLGVGTLRRDRRTDANYRIFPWVAI